MDDEYRDDVFQWLLIINPLINTNVPKTIQESPRIDISMMVKARESLAAAATTTTTTTTAAASRTKVDIHHIFDVTHPSAVHLGGESAYPRGQLAEGKEKEMENAIWKTTENENKGIKAREEEEEGGKGVLPLVTIDLWDDTRINEAQVRLSTQGDNVSDYWKENYKKNAGQYWHEFYKRNTDNFYKDRHYLHVEFPELLQYNDCSSGSCSSGGSGSSSIDSELLVQEAKEEGDAKPTKPIIQTHHVQMLEVGCGVGNAVIPLLELNSNLYVNAIDFATSAITILRKHASITKYSERLVANVCDVIHDELPLTEVARNNGLDIVLCMFVISAINPDQQQQVFNKLANSMKIGGRLLFRDYGRYDEAQLRFKKGSKIQENLYVRNDRTMAYYFDLSDLMKLCQNAGLMEIEGRCGYIRVQQTNRGQGKARHRVFVQGVFEKTAAS